MAGFADGSHKAAANTKENGSNGAGRGPGQVPAIPKKKTSAPTGGTTASPKKKTTAASAKSPTAVSANETPVTGASTTPSPNIVHAKANANWTKATTAAKLAAVADKNAKAKENRKLDERTLVSAMSWEFFSPPPSNSIKGKVIPRMLSRYQNRRKLSLEVHKVTPLLEEQEEAETGQSVISTLTKRISNLASPSSAGGTSKKQQQHSYEECVVRILSAPSKKLNRKYRAEAMLHLGKSSAEEYDAEDNFRFDDDDDDDDASVASTTDGAEAAKLADHGGKDYEGWKPRYSIPVQGVFIRLHHKKTVQVLISFDKVKQERDIVFDSLADAKKFVQELEQQKRMETERQEGRLKASLGGIVLPKLETLTLLFEIVSGYDLPNGDFKTSDPFVSCILGHQEVHRTKYISGTLDPIWTLKTGSLFLLTVESKRLFVEDGMKFIVKDFDQFGKDEVLGVVHVNPRTLYKSKGERMEFKLKPPHGSREKEVPGYLVIRARRASEYDQKFMADYSKFKGDKGVASYDHPKATTSFVKTMTTFNKKKDKDGTVRYKVRPGPDPKRADETAYLTDRELRKEVLKPSQQWTDIGQGDLAKVHVEILGCEGLPNMDAGGFMGNKTDAFVSIVFEDTYARTDTIDDCLSPQFMPWANRAFIFSMSHPSSILNLAVFDFDGSPLDDHDLIGRVSVDLSSFRPDTEYVLAYNLFPTSRVSQRTMQGQIKIRLRMEIPDERKLALVALQPPPPIYVNVKKKRDFNVIRQTCFGGVDEDRYSVSTLKSYIEELQEYQYTLFYVEDAAMTLFLWRGHFKVEIFGREIKLPIHSFNAFILSTFLVEHPHLFPSFFFLCVAWILLAVMGWRRNSVNIWQRCYSFTEILKMLVVGDSLVPPHKVEPYQNFDAVKQEMEQWVKRVEDAAKKAERDAAAALKEEEERQKELEEIGDADGDIGTKTGGGGISIDPVRAALYPIQLILGMVCRVLRFIKNVIIWQEVYFSFWIAMGSIAFSVICLFVPWFWIVKWTSRLIIWTIFGPWMKLLDVFYFSKLKPETDVERELREKAERMKRKLATAEAADKARQVRENAAKMKVMKKYMFGKFSMRIPVLKQDRYIDIPLPESSAVPHKEKELSLAELAMEEAGYNRKRIPGQTLVGDMIPSVASDAFTQAPIGKATARPERLAKDAPGARDKVGGDSTMTAYIKIVGVVVVAILASYFGTPVIVNVCRSLFDFLHMNLVKMKNKPSWLNDS